MRNVFTEQELNWIKEYYEQEGGVDKLMELTGRKRESIHAKARKMGLTPFRTSKNIPFTDKEIDLLIKYYEKENGVNKLVELTGRTRQSIHAKAKTMGLQSYNRRDGSTIMGRTKERAVESTQRWRKKNKDKLATTTMYLPKELKAEMEQYCRENRIYKSDLVEMAVKEFFKNNR